MKQLILLFTLTPIFLFSQTSYSSALSLQNRIRDYYDLNPLELDSELSRSAQQWAEHIVETGEFEVSDDNFGENIYRTSIEYVFSMGKQPCLEASLNWVLESEDQSTLNQIIFEGASRVGFGVAQNDEYIYVVAKYDKLYE